MRARLGGAGIARVKIIGSRQIEEASRSLNYSNFRHLS
jgi:hypothetical protein